MTPNAGATPEIGQTIYYRTPGNPYIQCTIVRGETSRSWLVGDEWRPRKIAKKTTTFVTEADWNEERWANTHRYRIANHIEHRDVSPEVLRKVAELIGYKGDAQ